MKDEKKKTLMKILAVWGGISLVLTLLVAGFFVYRINLDNKENIDKSSTSDVGFVMNWCNLGDSRIVKVLHSYESPISFNGDNFKAYEIEISNISIDELTKDENSSVKQWYRGDQLPTIVNDAITFVCSMQNKNTWLPSYSQIKTSDFYVHLWKIEYHGMSPDVADVILVEPQKRIVYYISLTI